MEHFTFSNMLFTATGAIVFWATKGGRSELSALGLGKLISFLPWSRGARSVAEFLVFIGLGCIVGIGFTEPSNARQALTAGFGWTSLLVVGRNCKPRV